MLKAAESEFVGGTRHGLLTEGQMPAGIAELGGEKSLGQAPPAPELGAPQACLRPAPRSPLRAGR